MDSGRLCEEHVCAELCPVLTLLAFPFFCVFLVAALAMIVTDMLAPIILSVSRFSIICRLWCVLRICAFRCGVILAVDSIFPSTLAWLVAPVPSFFFHNRLAKRQLWWTKKTLDTCNSQRSYYYRDIISLACYLLRYYNSVEFLLNLPWCKRKIHTTDCLLRAVLLFVFVVYQARTYFIRCYVSASAVNYLLLSCLDDHSDLFMVVYALLLFKIPVFRQVEL